MTLRGALLCLLASSAWAETFDVAQFSVPPGFTIETRRNQVQLLHIDEQRHFFFELVLYRSQPSVGSPAQDFASEWRQTVVPDFTVDAAPVASAPAAMKGVSFVGGGSEVSSKIGRSWAFLYVFLLEGRVVSVEVLATNRATVETMKPALSSFLDSLSFRGAPGTPAAQPAPRPAAPPSARLHRGDAKYTGAPIVGVWEGMKAGITIETSAQLSPRWRVFLADGSWCEDLPGEGLFTLDVAATKADPERGRWWGTYTVSGDRVTASQPSGRVQEFRLRGDELLEDPKVGKTKYSRAKSVDGLKLTGTWSTWLHWAETQAGPSWKSVPVIAFTGDGRFEDRGAFMGNPADALASAPPNQRPGRGSYEIAGYTLLLRYDDGREVSHPFTAAMAKDALRDASFFFIGKFPFYQR